MIHTEHLRKADESYEVRHDNNGNAVHAYIKDGKVLGLIQTSLILLRIISASIW